MRYHSLLKIVMPALLLTGSAAPSWAGGGGFGLGLGLGLGALFTADIIANSYPPYYPYPYSPAPYYPAPYYPYSYPAPYAYPPPQPTMNSAYSQPRQAVPAVQSIRQDTSRHDLPVVTDYHGELVALLDQKLKDGDITKGQSAAEVDRLDQMDRQARAEAAAQGGTLTGSEESALVEQYQQAYYLINHNFVVDR